MDELVQALQLISRNPSLARFAGPQSDEAVRDAEARLGVKLPDDYRRFLTELGGGSFGSDDFLGVGFASRVVTETLDERGQFELPASLVLVHHVGDGRVHAIDTTGEHSDGLDGAVVVWIHKSEPVRFAHGSFGEFLLSRVEWQIEQAGGRPTET